MKFYLLILSVLVALNLFFTFVIKAKNEKIDNLEIEINDKLDETVKCLNAQKKSELKLKTCYQKEYDILEACTTGED